MTLAHRIRLALTSVVAMLALGSVASAQTPEQFYKGKTLDFVIGYAPGGSNDVYSRLVAHYLGKHIPGNPNVVPKNQPGAGSFLAVNQIANVAPKDGLTIGLGAPTMAIDEKLGSQGVRFKTAQLNWIGRVDSLINMVFTRKDVKVQTFEDALKYETTLAGTGAGSTASIYPNVMNHVFGTKFKMVMGYRGSNEAMLAVERHEVDGHSTAWTALKVAHPDWIRDKKVSVFTQFSVKPHPEMADVPTVVSLARNDEERQVLTAIVSAAEVGTAFFTTPGAPADRVQALRRAFDATMKDPDFLADAQKSQLTVGAMTGEELQKLVGQLSDLPPALVEKVRAAYTAGAK